MGQRRTAPAEWDSTVIVVVNVEAGGMSGLGYTYGAAEAASLINATLAPTLTRKDIWDISSAHQSMRRRVRNMGASGIAATAISAVDVALWDLKARLLDLPLARLLGMRRLAVPVYGSGGFTNYDNARLRDQLAGWVAQGCRWVKIKVGTRSRSRSASASRRRATRSAMPGCSSTPTAPCRGGRRCTWPSMRGRPGCGGSRNRYPAMT